MTEEEIRQVRIAALRECLEVVRLRREIYTAEKDEARREVYKVPYMAKESACCEIIEGIEVLIKWEEKE